MTRPWFRLILCLAAAPFLAATTSGCTTLQPVQPWQKGVLAKPAMSFEGDRLDSATVPLPAGRKKVTLGTLKVTSVSEDAAGPCLTSPTSPSAPSP